MGVLTKSKVVKRFLGSASTWGAEQPIRKAKGTGSFLQLARMAGRSTYLWKHKGLAVASVAGACHVNLLRDTWWGRMALGIFILF